MAFYELTKRDFDFDYSNIVVLYRAADLAKVIAFKDRLKKPNAFNLQITKVEFIENADLSISRYEFLIYGERDLGPLFSSFSSTGFFDYRGEKLTEDQKIILGIHLKDSKSKLVDHLNTSRTYW